MERLVEIPDHVDPPSVGPLGEVVKNIRTVVIPQHDEQTYTTEWTYDTWNRLTSSDFLSEMRRYPLRALRARTVHESKSNKSTDLANCCLSFNCISLRALRPLRDAIVRGTEQDMRTQR